MKDSSCVFDSRRLSAFLRARKHSRRDVGVAKNQMDQGLSGAAPSRIGWEGESSSEP